MTCSCSCSCCCCCCCCCCCSCSCSCSCSCCCCCSNIYGCWCWWCCCWWWWLVFFLTPQGPDVVPVLNEARGTSESANEAGRSSDLKHASNIVKHGMCDCSLEGWHFCIVLWCLQWSDIRQSYQAIWLYGNPTALQRLWSASLVRNFLDCLPVRSE